MLYHLTSQINIKKTFSSRLLHPPRPPDTAHRDARLGVMLGAYGRASRLYAFPELALLPCGAVVLLHHEPARVQQRPQVRDADGHRRIAAYARPSCHTMALVGGVVPAMAFTDVVVVGETVARREKTAPPPG